MHLELKHNGKMSFTGTGSSGHKVEFDSSEAVGGEDTAARPYETFLMSAMGCSAMDVVSILRKMRENFTGLEVKMDLERASEHPKVPTAIKVDYIITGKNINRDNAEKAVRLSLEKYCSVFAVIQMANIPVDYNTVIVEE